MTHSELLAAIQLAYSRGDTRLFKINSGVAWQGEIIEHTDHRLVMLHPRAIRMGVEGMSDLCGWSGEGARFVAIEAKTGSGRATSPQRSFLQLVTMSGGLAGIARNLEDAKQILIGSK